MVCSDSDAMLQKSILQKASAPAQDISAWGAMVLCLLQHEIVKSDSRKDGVNGKLHFIRKYQRSVSFHKIK